MYGLFSLSFPGLGYVEAMGLKQGYDPCVWMHMYWHAYHELYDYQTTKPYHVTNDKHPLEVHHIALHHYIIQPRMKYELV